MPQFNVDPSNPKAEVFSSAQGGAPKSPMGKTKKPTPKLDDLKNRLMLAKNKFDKMPYSK
jgi:hypothetical protein